MQKAVPTHSPNAAEVNGLSADQVTSLLRSKDVTIEGMRQQIDTLMHRVAWFERQMFAARSERYAPQPDPAQMHLGEVFPSSAEPAPERRKAVAAHERRVAHSDMAEDADESSFFDESRVPVQIINVADPQIEGLTADQYDVIAQKVTYRLAQRPGSYVVLKYVREVTKRKDTQKVHCPPAPAGVLEGSRADVSFVAGLLVDKFQWHLPLYRQHQRIEGSGITVSRPWLTQISQRAIGLLEPVYEAQFDSIRASRVKSMDETPIKAGRTGHGKMRQAYYWPVHGDREEICFAYFPSRAALHVKEALGLKHAEDGVLLSDGYAAYESYTKAVGVTHAQCWVHSRRAFFEAQDADPEGVHAALEQIKKLYAIEEEMREQKLGGQNKRLHRLTHSKPVVDEFFDWVDGQFRKQGLLPSSPFTKALNYVRERRQGLEVFLSDPDVPLDTNHLERALRVIPMGRKSWLFCWTELGAEHVGIIQSLITTCRLQGIDPYTYLVDVLQRVGQLPASRVAELTPRLWKQHFAANPLRSDLQLAL
jgi:transposase